MADIIHQRSLAEYARSIRGKSDALLLLEQAGKQSAIDALDFLLKHGCTEANAQSMLRDLRSHAAMLRGECGLRGHAPLFERDQTGFN